MYNTFNPIPFCLIVSTPSSIFRFVRPFLIPSPHSVLCFTHIYDFTKLPSCSSLFQYSLLQRMDSSVSPCHNVLSAESPILVCLSGVRILSVIARSVIEFVSLRGVFAFDARRRTLFVALLAMVKLSFFGWRSVPCRPLPIGCFHLLPSRFLWISVSFQMVNF